MKPRLRLVIVAGIALLALGAVALFALRPAQAQSGLPEAKARWEAGALPNYRLRITQQRSRGACDQEMVAQSDVVTALQNSCGQPANWTVPRLFNWISELERTPKRCYPGPSRCACQGTISTSVRYDEQLGFPSEIVYEWRKRPNFVHPAYWRSLFDRSFPGCDQDGAEGTIIVNVTLTAEP
jgi:hypothetical protein